MLKGFEGKKINLKIIEVEALERLAVIARIA